MKKSVITLLLGLLVCYAFPQKPNAIIHKISNPPVIDGIVDEVWSLASPNNISLPFQVEGIFETPTLGKLGDTYWKALWDDNGVYIFLEIRDNVFSPCLGGCDSWEFDKPELYFDCNNVLMDGRGGQLGGNGHRQIAPGYAEAFLSGGVQTNWDGVLYAHAVADSDAVWEYFIPWEILVDMDGNEFNKGNLLGFDVVIFDNDTPGIPLPFNAGSRGRAVWANDGTGACGNESWNCMDDCGTISLEEGGLLLYLKEELLNTCGDRITLNPVISYFGNSELEFLWSPAEGLTAATIKNPAIIAKENQMYFLTVFSEDMGQVQDSVMVIVNPLKVHCEDFQSDSLICGKKVRMGMPTINSNGTATYTYLWSPSIGLDNPGIPQPEVEIIDNQVYSLEIASENNCIAVDSIRITIKPLQASVEDIQFECGKSIELNVTSNYVGPDDLIYNWEPSSSLSALDIRNPLASVTEPTRFSVSVSTKNGCNALAEAFVSPQGITNSPQICMVSVGANNRNIILWSESESQAIDSLIIYRESIYQSGLYELIGKLEFSAPSFFMDSSSNALVQSNRYKIAYKDICGFQTDLSSEHKTMHLNINMGMGNAWNLIWEEYEGFAVGSYLIYRGTSRDNLSMIGSTNEGSTSYTDFSAPAGDVYYQIEVIPPSLCGSLKSDAYTSSRSNISTNTSPSEIAGVGEHGEPAVYPNPASDIIYFRFISPQSSSISLYNLQGMEVLNGFITEEGFDISSLSMGIYFVKVLCPNNIYIKKIIKE
jgi:hypothetical protein